jgi:hypothetical protein
MTPEEGCIMSDERQNDDGSVPRDPIGGLLLNPTWEQLVAREPLIAFSWYLSGRRNVLVAIAAEIIENLDQAFAGAAVEGDRLERAESLMWLWILGAYEVVRTMCQAKSCFSARALDELAKLKRILAEVRMPAAKMEKRRKNVPVTSNRSPSGWDVSNRDLLVNDPEQTPDISARFILNEFHRVLSSITKDDVLGQHEESYSTHVGSDEN